MRDIWMALLDVWCTATASLPPDARQWERHVRRLNQQRSEDRLLATLRGELPRSRSGDHAPTAPDRSRGPGRAMPAA
jgi:hypothetical protein